MARSFLAAWVLPIDRPPVRRGWVEVDAGRVTRMGDGPPPPDADDLGDVALLPGLVNAHTHLELSWMAGRVPAADSLPEWLRSVIALRNAGPPKGSDAATVAMRRAAADMRATGTVLVGDVSNTLATPGVIEDAGLGGVVFHELLGFNTVDPALVVNQARRRMERLTIQWPERLAVVASAHAPYSASPGLITEIARRQTDGPITVHLAESAEEVEFLRSGTGPFRRMLEDLGVWHDGWVAPGVDPVTYLHQCGYLRPGMLAVHGVHLSRGGMAQLSSAGATLVTCPRSNLRVGAGVPHVARMYGAGVPVAIGTDSLASVPTLNLFDELAALRRLAPDVGAACLLESATRIGAEALGFGRDYGTIGPGKVAELVAVHVPATVVDVEEYLVRGIAADAIRPVH